MHLHDRLACCYYAFTLLLLKHSTFHTTKKKKRGKGSKELCKTEEKNKSSILFSWVWKPPLLKESRG